MANLQFFGSTVELSDPIQRMRNAKAKADKLADLFVNLEIPDWVWRARTRIDLYDQMLAHGYKFDLVNRQFQNGSVTNL